MKKERQTQVSNIANHGDYAFSKIEAIRLEMQKTIDANERELVVLYSDKAKLPKKVLEQELSISALADESKKATAEVMELRARLEGNPQVKEQDDQLQEELNVVESQVRAFG